MNQHQLFSFTSDAEFLVHAHALEQELVERYTELADSMEVHNNAAVAKLFRQLTNYGKTHSSKLIWQTKGLELPQVPPWEYQWLAKDELESSMQDAHYLMTTYQALKLALRMEKGAYDFYKKTAADSPVTAVKKLAAEMLSDKQRYLGQLEEWLEKEAAIHNLTPEDLDPPHIPE